MHRIEREDRIQKLKRALICLRGWVLLTIGFLPATAMAHHVMGGALPSTVGEGLLSGLGHPIIGLDHLLFVFALGALCWRLEVGPRPVASFLGASLLGIALHLTLIGVPGNESLVALSLLAIGISLWSDGGHSRRGVTIAAAIAGVFHGYAYGESIVGTEAGVLLAYLLGLIVIQSLIGAAAYWAAKSIAQRSASGNRVLRWTGALVSMLGAAFLLISFG